MKPKHRIVMLNVGQGDAFVVQLGSGEVIVIDCNRPLLGTTPPTISILEAVARQRGNANIDILCLTHPHLDHFWGMHEVFKWCKASGGTIGRLVVYLGMDQETINRLMRDVIKTRPTHGSDVLREFILLKNEIRSFQDSNTPDSFVLAVGAQRLIGKTDPNGHEYCVDAVGPLGLSVQGNLEENLRQVIRQMYEGVTSDDGRANDMSCLLSIRCKGCTILFTGDSAARLIADAWKSYVKTYGCGDRINIIKMPHHGSRGDISLWLDSKAIWGQLLSAGTLALLSYGQGNRYRHPHHDLLEVLRSSGVLTVSTNLCPKCARRGDTEADMFCDEEEEVLADGASVEAVEVTVDEVGNIRPALFDTGRQCEFCNSFVAYTAAAK